MYGGKKHVKIRRRQPPTNVSVFLKIFYLFIHERQKERERGRDIGRGRSRLHAGSPM